MIEENARDFVGTLKLKRIRTLNNKKSASYFLRFETRDFFGTNTAIQVASNDTGLPVRVIRLGSKQKATVMQGLL
jgi:hypothetical protein